MKRNHTKQNNKSNPLRLRSLQPYGLTVGLLVLIALLSWLIPSENLKMGQSSLDYLEGAWTVTTGQDPAQTVHLPVNLDLETNTPYEAAFVFQRDYPESQMLRLRASMQSVRVLLDETVLFESQKPASNGIVVPDASVWYFVALPSELAGRVLTIQLSSSVPSFSGLVNPVAIGTGDALLQELIETNRLTLLIVLFLLALGLLSILSAFLIQQFHDNRLFYLGLFAIVVAIWLFSEAKLMQILSGNRFWLGSVSYIAILLMPVPFLLYLRVTVLERYRRLLTGLVRVFLSLLIINITLQLTGAMSFIRSAVLTNGLILLTIMTVVACLCYEAFSRRNQSARQFLLATSALTITIIFEVISFLNASYDNISHYGRIGIVVFFLLLSVNSVRSVSRLLNQEREAQLMTRLAYHDIQTGGKNRLAFERDIEARMRDEKTDRFRLIMMDINNLKAINDAFGHRSGDQAIKSCYTAIVAGVGDKGTCYRIGGDEFACIIKPLSDDDFSLMKDTIRMHLLEAEEELPYALDIAIGSDLYHAQDALVLSDFLHRVDQLMYQDKKRQKEQNLVDWS